MRRVSASGMHPDPAGEDELHAGEADTVVGDLCELEYPVRDVHHDRLGIQVSRIDLRDRGREHLVDVPNLPLTARDRDGSPVWMTSVAFCAPTTAGIPSSRATIAACEVRPPRSVTMAEATFMIGSQSGSVISVTSTSPLRSSLSR